MQGATYSVDIVLCIDTTGSMQKLIDKVKANALRFYEELQQCMEEKEKKIDELRIRVIAFRDYYVDGDHAMRTSPFFRLPQEQEQFAAFVNPLQADGGGDDPENSLEALALAMQSDWAKSGDRRRQIIVMWTDNSAHPLEKNAGGKPGNYPTDLPQNFDDLTDMCEGQRYMSMAAKRLIIYAPDAYAWTDIANYWNNTLHYPSKAGDGLSNLDYRTILDAIANSV
jgi:hypothetical protein